MRVLGGSGRRLCSSLSGLEEEVAELGARKAAQVRRWPLDEYGQEVRTAKARRLGLTTSPHKLNLVARLVRGMPLEEAYRQLSGSKKWHSTDVANTIQAAAANALAFGLREERLVVSEAFVGKGSYKKQFRPHGKGKWGVEEKKYAHLTVIVQELDEEQWEHQVAPRYVHVQHRQKPSERVYDIEGWTVVSDLDRAFNTTRDSVLGLKAALGKPFLKRHDRLAITERNLTFEPQVETIETQTEAVKQ